MTGNDVETPLHPEVLSWRFIRRTHWLLAHATFGGGGEYALEFSYASGVVVRAGGRGGSSSGGCGSGVVGIGGQGGGGSSSGGCGSGVVGIGGQGGGGSSSGAGGGHGR